MEGFSIPKMCIRPLCYYPSGRQKTNAVLSKKNHNQYRFTCLCKLLIVFLCFLLFFGLLLLGTSRSIRRSRPTWTTWQESKPEAVKTHFKLLHHWYGSSYNPQSTNRMVPLLQLSLLTNAFISYNILTYYAHLRCVLGRF